MTVGRYARWTSVILFLLLSLSTLFCSLPAGAASSQKTLSGLSPAAMISRAREWVAADVPYSQSVAPSERFQNYRADCSGLVSMAWGIPAIPPNYGLNTTGLSQAADLLGKALDVTGKPIMDTMNKLQPGDILLNQGEDAHVILFVGWINIATKKVVSTPVQNTQDGNYYYDGIEENGDAGAIEHTSTHTLNSDPFDYSQPWPFPYYPGYNSQGYYAWRFDTTKAAQLGYETIQPSGEWMPPSPKDGDVITSDTLHLAATAYPTHKGDPPIAAVYFTLEFKGTWRVVCSPTTPSKSGSIYTCDANLPQLGISPGQVQVSFDVYDIAGGFNLAPNGVHTLTYAPSPTQTPVQPTLVVSPAILNHVVNACSLNTEFECVFVISSPSSNQHTILWRIGSPANPPNVSPTSGTLAPGQSTDVTLTLPDYICAVASPGTVLFRVYGGVSPLSVTLGIC